MSGNTIALFGHNGAIGKLTLRALAALGDQIKLKVYHRSTSDLSTVPPGIRKVEIDFDDEKTLASSLSGVDVVLSTIGNAGAKNELCLARATALAKIKNYIPSYYTTHAFTSGSEGAEFEELGAGFILDKFYLRKEIEKLGVPATFIVTGLFADFAITYGFVLPSVLRNSAEFYGSAGKTPFPIVSFEYVGQALAEIAAAKPTGSNQDITLIEYSPTGDELIATLETVNGSPPEIKYLTDDEIAARKNGKVPGPFVAIAALMKEKWGQGDVLQPLNEWKVKGMENRSLLDYMSFVKAHPPQPPNMSR